MGIDFSGGADALQELQHRMETLADGRISDAAGDALQASVPLVESSGRKGALALPSRGGLAASASSSLPLRSELQRGETASLTVKVLPGPVLKDPASANRGRLRHPTFGRTPFVVQLIQPGWWTNAMKAVAPQVRTLVREAIKESIHRR